MSKVIGYHLPEKVRKKIWVNLIESKRSFNLFSKGPSQHALNIAKIDKKIYDYFLSDYAKVA